MQIPKNVILNVAGGKIVPELPEGQSFLVNVDSMYYSHMSPGVIETILDNWVKNLDSESEKYYCNEDIFKFLERTRITFDFISVYRFLEHVDRDQVLYFIYLLSTAIKKGGVVDVIVPNYRTLAKRILHEDPYSQGFEKENIITSTEILNEKDDPHLSLWTVERAKYFFELEGRFKVTEFNPNEKFDGRDIYLRFKAKRL